MMQICVGCGALVDRFNKLKTPRCFICKKKKRTARSNRQPPARSRYYPELLKRGDK